MIKWARRHFIVLVVCVCGMWYCSQNLESLLSCSHSTFNSRMNKLLRLVVFAACLALVVCQAQAEAAAAKAKRKISQVIVLMMENR